MFSPLPLAGEVDARSAAGEGQRRMRVGSRERQIQARRSDPDPASVLPLAPQLRQHDRSQREHGHAEHGQQDAAVGEQVQ